MVNMSTMTQLARILILVSLVLGMFACAADENLVANLSEPDANEIMVVLQSQKIAAIKTSVPGRTVTYTISAKAADAVRAMRILVDNKLPRQASLGLAQVYPPGSSNIIPSQNEEKAKFLMAMQGEIENMLRILPGVVQARVAIVFPDTNAIRDINAAPPKATASVAIVYNPIDNKGHASMTADDVKYLVASAVEDLSPASVTVVLAANVPMRLANGSKGGGTGVATTTAPAAATPISAPPTPSTGPMEPMPPSQHPARATMPLQKSKSSDVGPLLWLFACLAVLGVALGIFGLRRSFSLKAKLVAAESAANMSLPPSPTQTPPPQRDAEDLKQNEGTQIG